MYNILKSIFVGMKLLKHTIIKNDYGDIDCRIIEISSDEYWFVDTRLRKGTIDIYHGKQYVEFKFKEAVRQTIDALHSLGHDCQKVEVVI